MQHGWVRESIRVRVIDKKYERGQLYNKKGVVVDVRRTDPHTCPSPQPNIPYAIVLAQVSGANSFAIRLDENQRLYEGLSHAMVQLPPSPSSRPRPLAAPTRTLAWYTGVYLLRCRRPHRSATPCASLER